MEKYEITYLVKNEEALAEKIAERAVEKIGGKIVSSKSLGQKDLAYPIDKITSACYATMVAELEPQMVADIDSALRMNDKVIRALIVKGVYEHKASDYMPSTRDTRDKKFNEKPVVRPVAEPFVSAPAKDKPLAVSAPKAKKADVAKPSPKTAKKAEEGISDAERLAQLEGKLKELLKE